MLCDRFVCVDASASAAADGAAFFCLRFGQLANSKKGVNEIENIFVVSVSFLTYARQDAKAKAARKRKET